MSQGQTETRGERKERTRRAILDAALALCEDSSLVALSLRAVAKEVGIVPTAFYRHFESIEDLGLALVDESFVSLRRMLREVRSSAPVATDIVDRSVEILVQHVRQESRHFEFIVRERAGGPPRVRTAIRHEVELCERELATDLARLPGTEVWTVDDLRVLSALFVASMVSTVETVLVAPHRPDVEKLLTDNARTQLRMILVGAANWHSRP